MLCAKNQYAEQMLAPSAHRADGPFFCPECHQSVTLKQGPIRMHHFAHPPGSICSYGGQAESDEHHQAKYTIYQNLLNAPGVYEVKLEQAFGKVRPDVSYLYRGCRIAIEVQI